MLIPVDYDAIREENIKRYGTDIGRTGRMLLAERYDDRTHFIFEVLQNAEDALKKRSKRGGQRSVAFSLSDDALTISHYGKPFDEADVRGVCGIGESTKQLTDIGRFGIGFKSVYAFTDTPEVHSGEEHFAIDSYVWPRSVATKSLETEETQIHIPFKGSEESAKDEVLKGLQRIGPRTLLFLREIEEVSWSVDGGHSGHYLRSNVEVPVGGARKVQIIGQDNVSGDIEEEWLVFSREVFSEGTSVGQVETAFALTLDTTDGQSQSVRRVTGFPLVVFFPTVLPTNLGFVLQGPYRTTPSRDNVPQRDAWNQHLVKETAILLTSSLQSLKQLGLLSVSALRCLPLDGSSFAEDSRFAPLFQSVRDNLKTEALLPAYGGGYIAAQNAKLAGSRELRELVSPEQLARLFESPDDLFWLSDDITPDRTSELYDYLTDELGIDAVTPISLVRRLTLELAPDFLVAQPDEWIESLYGFLNGQRGQDIRRLLPTIPLVRLEDGSHTCAIVDGKPQAYLPGDRQTEFPTVRRSVCQSDEAQEFLRQLGLRDPDLVDDVIENLLPKYDQEVVDIPDRAYQSDIERIVAALATDSASQRNNLVSHLREAKFVFAVDAGSGAGQFVRPAAAYMATERLTGLFQGVHKVLFVDNSKLGLRAEPARAMLRAAGTPEYLAQTRVEPSLTGEDKRELRRRFGDENISHERAVEDHTLMGLDPLLEALNDLPADLAPQRASLLWEALCDVQTIRGDNAFSGRYHWFRYSDRIARFPARFVERLNAAAWVPDKDGVLQVPGSVVFQDTGWEQDPALAAKISFKSSAIDELAKVAGIDSGALDLLRKHGISEAKLRELLSLADDSDDPVPLDSPAGGQEPVIAPTTATPGADSSTNLTGTAGSGQSQSASSPGGGAVNQPTGRREFITYVRVSPDDSDEDPDGLTHKARMDLESKAIAFILSREPDLEPTPEGNPGYDLSQPGPDGEPVKWVEVKAMSGTLQNRPATLSKTQFDLARKREDAYWLYVVENAGDPAQIHIVKIQNPAGKAQTFTFDRGWIALSE